MTASKKSSLVKSNKLIQADPERRNTWVKAGRHGKYQSYVDRIYDAIYHTILTQLIAGSFHSRTRLHRSPTRHLLE
jgi:hypothetical protein